MRVDGSDHPKPAAATTATPSPFQRVLQRAEALPSSTAEGHRPSLHMIPDKPPLRLPRPPGSTAPAPHTSPPLPLPFSRVPGTTVLPSGTARALARSGLASPENLGKVRQAMNRESLRLGSVRAEGQTTLQQSTEHRLSELIFRELARQLRQEPTMGQPPPRATPLEESSRGVSPVEGLSAGGASRLAREPESLVPPEPSNPEAKAQATAQLIEKLELFVQCQRPALRLSLGWPLSAMVEVERTGPREVALRIMGRQGPLGREDLARIREAMGVRGLKLRSLRTE